MATKNGWQTPTAWPNAERRLTPNTRLDETGLSLTRTQKNVAQSLNSPKLPSTPAKRTSSAFCGLMVSPG